MVDLQAHALPGADRGAPDEQAALAMCRYAAGRGTRELVLAPTTDLSQPWAPEQADAAIGRLQAELGDAIHLHRGCEVKLTEAAVALVRADPARYTLNGRQYLLLDASSQSLQREAVAELLDRLRELGVIAVIAAPERALGCEGIPGGCRAGRSGALFQPAPARSRVCSARRRSWGGGSARGRAGAVRGQRRPQCRQPASGSARGLGLSGLPLGRRRPSAHRQPLGPRFGRPIARRAAASADVPRWARRCRRSRAAMR